MLKQIKQRARIDELKNDVRTKKPLINWGQLIYFCVLGAFLYGLLNFVYGSYFFFQSKGLVMQPHNAITSLFTARVKQVHIAPGAAVEKGQKLLTVESADLIRQIAELSAAIAELTNKNAQMKAKAKATKQLLPVLQLQLQQARLNLRRVKRLHKEGLSTAARLSDVMEKHIQVTKTYEKNQMEASVLEEKYALTKQATDNAKDALVKLQNVYNDGIIRAPISGNLSPKIVSIGDVATTGTPIFKIHHGEPYIAAYVPNHYKFDVVIGTKLKIYSGPHTIIGIIKEILPVAAEMPREFQNSIQPIGRSRVIKIEVPSKVNFAISQKVNVKSCWFKDCVFAAKSWGELFEDMKQLVKNQIAKWQDGQHPAKTADLNIR